ncbi:PEP-CTERM sorting domain-containing protein [Massilia aurea]|uniref:PEP-CTERM sorting domain-containing protein n=1 Tax=Massilia aurea TaxID=373040 RepID=UPI0034625A0A
MSTAIKKMFVGLSLCACSSAFAAPFVINFANIESNGEFGDSANIVQLYQIGANSVITSFTFSGLLTAIPASFLSELTLTLTDSALSTGINYRPGIDDAFPGTASYTEFVDLTADNDSFAVGSDGILRLEFNELFDDFPGADGIWNFGTLTLEVEAPGQVPEPATGLLLGAGLAMMGYAGRRRKAAGKAAQRA